MSDNKTTVIIEAKDATGAGISTAKKSVESIGASAKIGKQELQQLSRAFSDSIAMSANGVRPLTLLIQQGPDLVQSFGGVGPMFTKISAALGPMGVVAAGTAASVALLGGAIYKTQNDSIEFNKAIQATGNYAGMTEEKFRSMAESLSLLNNDSIGATKDRMLSVMGRGVFDDKEIALVSTAMVNLERVTGKSADGIADSFVKLKSNVADSAAEMNKSMHFLTGAEYAQVSALEDAGKKSEAFALVMDRLNDKLREQKENVGLLEGSLRKLSAGWSGWMDTIGHFGEDTDQKRRDYAYDQLGKALTAKADWKAKNGDGPTPAADARIALWEAEIKKLNEKSNAEKKAAEESKKNAEVAGKQIDAQRYFDALDKSSKSAAGLNKELAELKRRRDDLAGSPQAISDKDYKTYEASIRKKYQNPAAEKLQSAYERERDKLGEEGASLDSQIDQFKRYGDSVNHARQAEVEFLVTQGKLKDASPAQIEKLRALAARDDDKAASLNALKDAAGLEKKVKAIQAEGDAQELSARATQKAGLMADLDLIKTRISADEYERLAAAINKAVDARANRNLGKVLGEQRAANDESIKALEEESRLIGANSLQRDLVSQKNALFAKRDKIIRDDPTKSAEITEDFDGQWVRLSAAIEKNYTLSRDWKTGWQNAFASYKENATNAAEAARTVFDSVTGSMEDMLATFIVKGKLDFSTFAQSIAADLAKIAAKQMVAKAASVMFNANGNAFGPGGPVQAFAQGDVFDEPTFFRFSQGGAFRAGVMGEAGPEAVMPLRRTSNGKLGVVAQGGGGVVVSPTIHVTVQGGQSDAQSQRQGEQISQQVAEQVRKVTLQTIAEQQRSRGRLAA